MSAKGTTSLHLMSLQNYCYSWGVEYSAKKMKGPVAHHEEEKRLVGLRHVHKSIYLSLHQKCRLIEELEERTWLDRVDLGISGAAQGSLTWYCSNAMDDHQSTFFWKTLAENTYVVGHSISYTGRAIIKWNFFSCMYSLRAHVHVHV